MLTWAKIILLPVLTAVSLQVRSAGLIILLISTALLTAGTGTSLKELCRKNIFIFVFAATISVLALVTGLLRGMVPYGDIGLAAARIVLIFNCTILGARWIGHEGTHRLLASIPSMRVRMFFILFGRMYQSLARSHRSVIDRLRSRLDMTATDRLLIARYYMQNLMEKETYSYRFHQAVIVTRLTVEPTLVWEKERMKPADVLIITLITSLCAGALIFL